MLLPLGNNHNGHATARVRASRMLFLIWSPWSLRGVQTPPSHPVASTGVHEASC